MTDDSSPKPFDAQAVRRGRLMALMLFAIAALPVILASAMYFGGWGPAGGAGNKGELIQPVGAVADFGFRGPEGNPLEQRFYPAEEEPKWLVLLVAERCGEGCTAALHDIRQVHIALNRESGRVRRAVWARELPEGVLDQYPALVPLELQSGLDSPGTLPGNANLDQSHQIYVVDPNGNVVLRYDDSNAPEDLLDDLKKLLRLSNIG